MSKTDNNWSEQLSPPPKIEINEKKLEEADVEKQDDNEHSIGVCRSIRIYFREYCENSSLHGIRYMGEKNRTIVERIWWITIFIVSIFLCSTLILKTYTKWELSPVIVSFAQSPTPVWQVPFPAVTICSETKARQTIFNFTDHYKRKGNLSPAEARKFQDSTLVCDQHLYTKGDRFTDQKAVKFIDDIAPHFDDTLMQCKWMNQHNVSCELLFSPMLTEEGLCYTFNMLDSTNVLNEEVQNEHYLHNNMSSDWNLHTGYKSGSTMSTYPLRALGAGKKAGLTILLRAVEEDMDYLCRGPVQGFKILLHNPAETPRVSQQYFRAPLNQEVVVAVKPDMMTTSEGLQDYHPARRHCYFPNEKKLRFFKIYTQQNCEIECLTIYTLHHCKCVSYHMPHNNTTKICGSGSTRCVTEAQRRLVLQEVESEISEQDLHESELTESLHKCNCLPACTSLHYNAETSQADFNWKKLFTAFGDDPNNYPGIHMTRINIFFKDNQFITSRRSELYGQTDFLANCGGLLGLFMGFSFLSLVEIIYFLTLRMWCNIHMYGRKLWGAQLIHEKTG